MFVRSQTRARSPLLPLDIFTSRRYSFAVLTSVTMFVSQGIALVALPFVLQAAHGYSVLESALVFTPWPIAVALCAPIAGRLVYRLNATQVSSAGVFMFCLGLGSLMLLPEHATITDLVWRIALCGMGYGFFLPPNNKEMFANAARNRTGTASGVLSTARTTGQSIGAALVAVVIALTGGIGDGAGASFATYVFALACAIAALSLVASLARVSAAGWGAIGLPHSTLTPPQHFQRRVHLRQQLPAGLPDQSQRQARRFPAGQHLDQAAVAQGVAGQPGRQLGDAAAGDHGVELGLGIAQRDRAFDRHAAHGGGQAGGRHLAQRHAPGGAPSARAYATASWRESSSTSFGAPRRSR